MTAPALPSSPRRIPTLWRTLTYLISFLSLIWLLAARIAGPDDLWNQTQPKTVAYTTDIIVHAGSHWLLPQEPGLDRGDTPGPLPATKPPLYNWCAVPFVKLLGFTSALAHKSPSVISIFLVWLIILLLGRSLGTKFLGPDGDLLGPLAAMMTVSNHTIFKLGYLARPDMLLTLWLILGWLITTFCLLRASSPLPHKGEGRVRVSSPLLLFSFFLTVALAGLTKGPAAIILLLFLFIFSRITTRSFLTPLKQNPLAFALGSLTALALISAWAISVYHINPDHFRNVLLGREIIGRITGEGREGGDKNLLQIILEIPNHPLFYLIRFAPWSILSLLAIFQLWRSRSMNIDGATTRRVSSPESRASTLSPSGRWLGEGSIQPPSLEGGGEGVGETKKSNNGATPRPTFSTESRTDHSSPLPHEGEGDCESSSDRVRVTQPRSPCDAFSSPLRPWLLSATLLIILIIALFSLSAGKRADYLAAAYPAGSILAAAYWLNGPLRLGRRFPFLAPLTACLCLTGLTLELNHDRYAPTPAFSASLRTFIDKAHAQLTSAPLPLVFYNAGDTHLQALLGFSELDSRKPILDLIDQHKTFYVISGSWKSKDSPDTLTDLPAWLAERHEPVTLDILLRSQGDARTDSWPAPLILTRISPLPK
ncbi:MAG TPA: hypothetical protein VG711_06690 [Phycisphaerales bacterium]|nr:hypothetical protein [Phycisphaerales bacterium]